MSGCQGEGRCANPGFFLIVALAWGVLFLGPYGRGPLEMDGMTYSALAKHMSESGNWRVPHYTHSAYDAHHGSTNCIQRKETGKWAVWRREAQERSELTASSKYRCTKARKRASNTSRLKVAACARMAEGSNCTASSDMTTARRACGVCW